MNEVAGLKLLDLLSGNLTRIRNVIRFSNSTRIKDETVAEHSYFAAYYALILARVLETRHTEININYGNLLARALLHDLDEAISGDFVRHFKYINPDLHKRLDEASKELMKSEAFLSMFTDKFLAETGHRVPSELYVDWNEAKRNDIEGDIVAFADFLSVLSYVMNELDCGNKKLLTQLDDMHEYAESFYKRSIFQKYEEAKCWLQQVKILLNAYVGSKYDGE